MIDINTLSDKQKQRINKIIQSRRVAIYKLREERHQQRLLQNKKAVKDKDINIDKDMTTNQTEIRDEKKDEVKQEVKEETIKHSADVKNATNPANPANPANQVSSLATQAIAVKESVEERKIYLVTFDNSPKYAAIARSFVKTYEKVGIYKHYRWHQSIMEKTLFFKNNKYIFSHRKGFGGWIWKPFIIYDALKKIDNGDYVYYQDCFNDLRGFQYNVRPVIDFMEKSNIDILPGLMEPYYNKAFTKTALLKHFNFDNNGISFLNKNHICASPIFIKKNENTLNIIKEWLDLCQIPEYILPHPNPTNVQHNYDMSIWNCILEKYKIKPLNIRLDKRDTKNFNIYLQLFSNKNLRLLN